MFLERKQIQALNEASDFAPETELSRQFADTGESADVDAVMLESKAAFEVKQARPGTLATE